MNWDGMMGGMGMLGFGIALLLAILVLGLGGADQISAKLMRRVANLYRRFA